MCLVEVQQRKVLVQTFLVLSHPRWSDGFHAWTFESRNFFCLNMSYPAKSSRLVSTNWELSNGVSLVDLRGRKVACQTRSHLTQTKAWQRAGSNTTEGRRVSSEVLEPLQGLLWQPAKSGANWFSRFQTYGEQRDRQTDWQTISQIYKTLAVIPLLCTSRPYLLFNFNWLFAGSLWT